MVYTILISIVFIAELIITITTLQNLIKLDKCIIQLDETISEAKPSIKDISTLLRKISKQWVIISQNFVDNARADGEEFLLRKISKILMGFFILNLNLKFIKRIQKNKVVKMLSKGWSLLESMI